MSLPTANVLPAWSSAASRQPGAQYARYALVVMWLRATAGRETECYALIVQASLDHRQQCEGDRVAWLGRDTAFIGE
jgi:hypothetical protein